jgi:hypothetical protein
MRAGTRLSLTRGRESGAGTTDLLLGALAFESRHSDCAAPPEKQKTPPYGVLEAEDGTRVPATFGIAARSSLAESRCR